MKQELLRTIVGCNVLFVVVICALMTNSLAADDLTWIGGDGTWTDGVGAGLFTGNDEPDPDDRVLFTSNHTVSLGSNNQVMFLYMANSATVLTRTHQLEVDGGIDLSAGTRLGVGGNNLAGLPVVGLETELLGVNPGARLSLGDTTIALNRPGNSTGRIIIETGGTFYGNGRILSTDDSTNPFRMLDNSGTLSVGNFTVGTVLSGPTPPVRTLTIDALSSNARVDLDGTDETGTVDIPRNQTLNISVPLFDAFSGTINLAHNSRLDIDNSWILAGGVINLDNGFVPASTIPSRPAIPADNAVIAGDGVTMITGAINIAGSDSTLIWEATRGSVFKEVVITGGGKLIVSQTGGVSIDVASDLDVVVENRGHFSIQGQFSQGFSTHLNVNAFEQTASGTLRPTIYGDDPWQFSRIIVGGDAELAGAIEFNDPFDDVVLTPYNSLSILTTVGNVSGTFGTVERDATGFLLDSNEGLAVTYTPTTVDVTRAFLGDANLDQKVDVLTDAAALVNNLGTNSGATWADGDFTGDGKVDVLGDAAALIDNLGIGSNANASATSAVPEPGCLTLLATLSCLVAAGRRRSVSYWSTSVASPQGQCERSH